MITRSLKWRMVTIYVLLVLIVMIACGTMIVTSISRSAYKGIEDNLKETITKSMESIETGNTKEEVRNNWIDIIDGYKDSERLFYLLNTDGTVEYPRENIIRDRFNNSMIIAAAHDKERKEYDTFIDGEGPYRKEYRGYARPLKVNGKVAYVVYILAPSGQVKENLASTIKIIIFAIIVAIVLSIFFGFMFSSFLTKPIIALSNKARAMSEGDLVNTIEVLSEDEIGELTQNFNIMAKELNHNLTQISSEKNKLETVFAHMTDGILVFDSNGMLIHSNPASRNLLDLEEKEQYGEIFALYLDMTYDELIEYVITGTRQHIIRLGDKYVNLCFAPYLDRHENILGTISVIQDITEHKKLEEMQKEFVANVSHELRTPLTTIKSYAETLLDGAVDERELALNFLNVINHEADRMTALVQDLLELSRLDNKQTKFKMQDISLSHIVEGSVDKYQIHAKKKNQIMVYERTSDDYKITGDAGRIEQVIKNIISNAVKYSYEEATIQIEVMERGRFIVVTIQDTGMGIPEEDLSRIFDRFYRVDKARSRAMGGTGLGLAIAKEIMECHGGHIKVNSEIGVGTCFHLYFPYEKREAQ
ncbi:HAMP domain-containing protein [Vallitalea pronyensis]|uniref:histidine kinase n=1 Tax=Vallitalea pronyensis TaxID=1348613 RepID=A0A8J8MGR7_9FIRM|nr:ATP-binding protein [Vallitalea pronyensis]QUI21294.1 HAMP domain-containing protein [Vallitalea pronyensis]